MTGTRTTTAGGIQRRRTPETENDLSLTAGSVGESELPPIRVQYGSNETQATRNESTCLLCGVPLKVQSKGRPPRFCSPGHRVRYHRLQKRSDKAGSGAAAPAPNSLAPPERGRDERIKALHELAYMLEDLRPSGRIAELRRLAQYAEDLILVLDTIEKSAWALDELSEVALALENLQEHRGMLDRLSQLDDLAGDVDKLPRDLREARRYYDDLYWAIGKLEDLEEELP